MHVFDMWYCEHMWCMLDCRHSYKGPSIALLNLYTVRQITGKHYICFLIRYVTEQNCCVLLSVCALACHVCYMLCSYAVVIMKPPSHLTISSVHYDRYPSMYCTLHKIHISS